MSILEAVTSTIGEALDELRGFLMTRLTAQGLALGQVARGTGNTSSVDGLVVTLDSGSFDAEVQAGRTFRLLSGALAGEEATILTVDGPAQITLDTALTAPWTSQSWEVERPADTEISVESTLYWQDAGEFYLGGIRYRYTGRTATSLSGLTHWDGEAWLPGLAQQQEPLDVVSDYSRARTQIDQLRRSFFVETGEGDALSTYGANIGRPRPEALADDDLYRAWLRAIGYGPFGTRLLLWEILDAVVGVGNWETFEDFTSPEDDFALIYVRPTSEDPTSLLGKTILDGSELVPATAATTVDVTGTPTVIGSVELAPETSARTVASGLGASSADGITIDGPASQFPARILPGDTFEVLTGPRRGERARVQARVSDTELTLGTVEGYGFDVLSGASGTFEWRITREVTDCRYGQPSDDTAEEYPGDAGTQAWSWQGTEAEVTGAVVMNSGALGRRTTIGSNIIGQTGWYSRSIRIVPDSNCVLELVAKPVTASVLESDGRQWLFSIRDGERAIAAAFFYEDGGEDAIAFVNVDTGVALHTPVVLQPTSATYRNFRLIKRGRGRVELWADQQLIATRDYADFFAVTETEFRFGCTGVAAAAVAEVRAIAWYGHTPVDYWAARATAADVTAAPDRDVGSLGGIVQVGDVGRVLWVRGGNARNPGGGNANGEWEIEARVDASTATVIGRTRDGATFRRGYGSMIFLPEDLALPFPDALGHSIEILTGPETGVYPITRMLGDDFEDLAVAPDSELESDLGEAASRGTSVVIEVSGAPAGGFTATDGEYQWRVVPVFAADTGLLAEISDAGTLAGQTLTLRQALPITSPLPVLEVSYSTLDSAHTEAESARNDSSTPLTPFYLYDVWGLSREVIEGAVAEGIKVDLDSLQRDDAGLHVVED